MATVTRIVIARLRICGRESWTLPMRVTPLGNQMVGREQDSHKATCIAERDTAIGQLDDG